MTKFDLIKNFGNKIEEVKSARDNAFYTSDGNQLYNVDTDECFFNADLIEKLDTKIDELFNIYLDSTAG